MPPQVFDRAGLIQFLLNTFTVLAGRSCEGGFIMPRVGRLSAGLLVAFTILALAGPAGAQEELTIAEVKRLADFVWVLLAAALVFVMQFGFLFLEAGMVRSKNSISVTQKNILDFGFSVVAFALVGFMLAFGASDRLPFGFDLDLLGLRNLDSWTWAYFVFQVMFCGTAATIVSGAVAERMKLGVYVLCSIALAGLVYPVFVHWAWGSGLTPNGGSFLGNMGFVDFAGSTVVHCTGAWIALAACVVMGPRIGRYDANGNPVRLSGHNPVLAGGGALLLFVGWVGFNGGSTVAATTDTAHIIANTVLAGASGMVAGYLLGWWQDGVVLPEKTVNGLLGGLVAVTAGCYVLDGTGSLIVGVLGAAAALFGNDLLERRLKVDDAVGAIGVHGFGGVVGTVALVFLAPASHLPHDRLTQLGVQLLGSGLNFAWAFGMGILFMKIIDATIGARVAAEAEEQGLNVAEHATRLGIGHVEDAFGALVQGDADLSMRLKVEPGDEAERLTHVFNSLMDNLQREELARGEAVEVKRSAEEAERLSALADATFEALCISVDGEVIDGNAALERLIGRPIERMKGRRLHEFVDSADWPKIDAPPGGDAAPYEIMALDAQGAPIPVEVRARWITYKGEATQVLAIVDLRDRKKAEAQIRHLAQHDPLTNLPNRALFNDQLEEMIERTVRRQSTSSVILVDLDRFKDINDLYGHPAGDEVLKETAERLRAVVRPGDMVARLGGDEFAVLQFDLAFASQAADLAYRIVQMLSKPIVVGEGVKVRAGCSVGVAICPRDGIEGVKLITRADTALYHAKNRGRDCYAVFEEGMDADLRRRRLLEVDLVQAIEQEQFELHFQPRMEVATARVSGYEALVRWRHPHKGLISPADFIPVAERSGKIVKIGDWVIKQACRMAAAKLHGAHVSVNVSPMQFREPRLVETVQSALTESGLSSERLEIEITESVLIDDDKRAIAMLKELKALGVKVALDDFGTGYSSLGYLSRFPFDVIKIDRSFVQGLGKDPNALAIVDTIMRLGRALNMRIVAEGVEQASELKLLGERGCDEIQGFLLGKPVPIAETPMEVSDEIRLALASLDTREAAVRALRRLADDLRRPPRAAAG
jgi:Amt family ammonium transporter